MDVRLINPFARATKHVFKLIVGCSLTADRPQAFATLPPGDTTANAIITLRGGASGVVMLRFPSPVVLSVGMAFAGTDVTRDDAYDALGELANMVVGNAKQELAGQLVEVSIPKIAVGDRELGEVAKLSPWLCIPFTATLGQFFLSISISSRD